MAPLAGLREELYQEMLSHVKQTDVSVPFRDGDWWYYTRTEEGLQYAIHCRKRGGPSRTPDERCAGRSVLDGNQLAEGHAFFAIGDTDITDDGRWLAYTTDTTGFRQYTLHIKDLRPAKRCRRSRARRLRRLGRGQSHALLHRRRRGAEAPVPALAACAGTPTF
jgi:oligopeptidase B